MPGKPLAPVQSGEGKSVERVLDAIAPEAGSATTGCALRSRATLRQPCMMFALMPCAIATFVTVLLS